VERVSQAQQESKVLAFIKEPCGSKCGEDQLCL
jgi:hypothetical protein